MERRPRNPEEEHEQPLPDEHAGSVEIEPGQAWKIIRDGMAAAEAAGRDIEDWVARHIAWQLRTGDGSPLDTFARSGCISDDFRSELIGNYDQAGTTRRRWIEAIDSYASHREDRQPVDGWAERARLRDQFHADWWDRDERGNRYLEARDLDREITLAQDARQLVDNVLATRLLVRVAHSPHSAVARFAAEGRVTDELSRELQEKYLSGTEQERRWLSELGSWITASGEPSPIPWWRSPAPVEEPMPEQPDASAAAIRRAGQLADLEERLAPLPDLGDIPRPAWGHGFGNGWEWMEEGLPGGWHAEPIWGRYGWDLGAWPLIVVALFIDDEGQRYAVATFTEGDINIKRYKSRGALYVSVDKIAEFHWRLGQSRGPRDLPEGGGLLAHHTGPYPGWSSAREAATRPEHPEQGEY